MSGENVGDREVTIEVYSVQNKMEQCVLIERLKHDETYSEKELGCFYYELYEETSDVPFTLKVYLDNFVPALFKLYIYQEIDHTLRDKMKFILSGIRKKFSLKQIKNEVEHG